MTKTDHINDPEFGLSVEKDPLDIPHHPAPAWMKSIQKARDNLGLRSFFAEAIGSFWFVFLLIVSIGGMELTDFKAGSFVSAILALGVAVMMCVYLTAPVSGGHLSPPITIAMAVFRGFPWTQVPVYLLAQFTGALFAGVISYALCSPWIKALVKAKAMTEAASITVFLAQPPAFLTNGQLILVEFVGDVIFMFIATMLTDPKNPLVTPRATPALIGATVFVVATGFGWQPFVLNPFRDFGPRVYLSAYYDGLFALNGYWAIALFVPVAAHLVGMFLYDVLIGKNYD